MSKQIVLLQGFPEIIARQKFGATMTDSKPDSFDFTRNKKTDKEIKSGYAEYDKAKVEWENKWIFNPDHPPIKDAFIHESYVIDGTIIDCSDDPNISPECKAAEEKGGFDFIFTKIKSNSYHMSYCMPEERKMWLIETESIGSIVDELTKVPSSQIVITKMTRGLSNIWTRSHIDFIIGTFAFFA